MEEERTNLAPRLQQDAYLHGLAAAQPGRHYCQRRLRVAREAFSPSPELLEEHSSVHAVSDTPLVAQYDCAFEIASDHQSAIATTSNPYGVQVASATDFSGGHPSASSQPSAFPYSVGNYSIINECSNTNWAPSNESHNFTQGLSAAGTPDGYLSDPFDNPTTLSFDANGSLSGQPQAFSTGALNLTSSRYAEGGYGGVSAAHQYYSAPSNYPFATDAAFNGTDTFATGPTTYTNGHVTADNPMPMPVSYNPIVPLDIGSMTGGSTPLSPNIYNTGQAIANNSLPVSNNPIAPWDIGFMTEDPFAHSPKIYTTGQTSANYPFSMQGSKYPIVPMNTGFTTEPPFGLPPNTYNTGQASANNPFSKPTSNNALIPIDIGPPIQQRPLCTQCNKTLSRPSDLERHALKHGPKNVKCQVQGCKYRTYRKDKLSDHVKCRHPAAGTRST